MATKKLLQVGATSGVVAIGLLQYVPKFQESRRNKMLSKNTVDPEVARLFSGPLPRREVMLQQIENQDYGRKDDKIVDVLVIGAGATGSGVALDAVTRGLTTVCAEKFDFASGTSSRSTKLIHGGVRYLQKAIFNLDREQYNMVKEALNERANLIDICPHAASPLPIMLPIYKLWQVPYYWMGIKMYDLVSGSQILKASYFLSKSQALERFPLLRKDKLVGALVYYDGQHDDARMCLNIAMTAIRYGAKCVNYLECVRLLKGPPVDHPDSNSDKAPEVVNGAVLVDRLTGKEYTVRARCVINATGPYTDSVRSMAKTSVKKICQPSSGVHIVLPGYYSPKDMGLLDPSTKDGRVIFFLPWMHGSLAGTTDTPCEVTDGPIPGENDVNFILDEIRSYLSPEIKVRRGDVLSAWSGIRPLVMDPNSKDTQSIARNHIIEVSEDGLVTIAGGKWTTYRSMAEETVDKVLEVTPGLPETSPCRTKGLMLEGGHKFSPNLFIRLVQDFGIEPEVAQHLTFTYGDKAVRIAEMTELTGLRWPLAGKRLHPEFPYLESEVRWACREYACRAIDFLARRSRLSFLNVQAAREALPRVVEIMGDELGWSKAKREAEKAHAISFVENEMGLSMKAARDLPISLSRNEYDEYVQQFKKIDIRNKGFITINDLRKYFKSTNIKVSDAMLQSLLDEIDLNRNGQVEVMEFLQFMSALKTGAVSHTSMHILNKSKITVDRSCGGV